MSDHEKEQSSHRAITGRCGLSIRDYPASDPVRKMSLMFFNSPRLAAAVVLFASETGPGYRMAMVKSSGGNTPSVVMWNDERLADRVQMVPELL